MIAVSGSAHDSSGKPAFTAYLTADTGARAARFTPRAEKIAQWATHTAI